MKPNNHPTQLQITNITTMPRLIFHTLIGLLLTTNAWANLTATEGDIDLKSVNLEGEQVKLESKAGKVILGALKDQSWYTRHKETKGNLTNNVKGKSKTDEDTRMTTIRTANLSVNAKEGIEIAIDEDHYDKAAGTQSKDPQPAQPLKAQATGAASAGLIHTKPAPHPLSAQAVGALSEARTSSWPDGTGYIDQLLSEGAKANEVTETHTSTSYNHTSLSSAAQLAVTVAVSAATGGVGGAVVGAGLSSLASQAAIASINSALSGNDLGSAVHAGTQQGLSEESLNAAARAMATAGVAKGIGEYADLGNSYANATAQGVGAGIVNTAYDGGDALQNILDSTKSSLINQAGADGAKWIGDEYAAGARESAGGWLQHKGMHAMLGCAMGQADGNDCKSGAFGGVMGETSGELLGGTGISDTQLLAGAQIATIFAADAAGLDFNTANETAANAVKNNYLNHRENAELEKAKKACVLNDGRDSAACAKVVELGKKSRERDKEFNEAYDDCLQNGNCEKINALHFAQRERWNEEFEDEFLENGTENFVEADAESAVWHNQPDALTDEAFRTQQKSGYKKLVHTNGQGEIVVDGQGRIVTANEQKAKENPDQYVYDPKNIGTYNYYQNPSIGHVNYDIDPHINFGSALNDPTTMNQRLLRYEYLESMSNTGSAKSKFAKIFNIGLGQ